MAMFKEEELYFYSDVLFKFALSKEYPECLKIRRFIIKEVTGIIEKNLVVKNPVISPRAINDKENIFDTLVEGDEALYMIEMQGSKLDDDHNTRYHHYGNSVRAEMVHRGEHYNEIKPAHMILFALDYQEGTNKLIVERDIYYTDTNLRVKHHLGRFFIVQIPYIDVIKEQKEVLTEFEGLVYYIYHNDTEDIDYDNKERMVDMFKRLRSIFVKENPQEAWDALARHAMYIDYDKAKERAEQWGVERGREEGIIQGKTEGIQEGIQQGELKVQRGITINLFKRRYPTHDSSFLDKLTFKQYRTVYDMLLDDKSISEIQSVLQYA